MKILMQNRADLFDKPGGDLVQMQKTQAALQSLGISVDISTELEPDVSGYDVVHLYNITRIHETLAQLRHAKRHGTPVVLSPIYHKMAEIERYERLGRTGTLRMVNSILRTTSSRETLKNVARSLDSRQRPAIMATMKRGFYQAQREVLEKVDGWVVLAETEAEAIKSDFRVDNQSTVARNAVDQQFFKADRASFVERYELEDFVLCVSRIEDRKNQIRLIEAMQGMGQQLVFIGGLNSNHREYVDKFRQLVQANSSWVTYLGPLSYDTLPSAYAAAKIHALPSWFEVVSLTALEAAAAGCVGVVADTGYMHEYLGDEVSWCDPAYGDSIRTAFEQVSKRARTETLVRMMKPLTWNETAKQTIAAYQSVIH